VHNNNVFLSPVAKSIPFDNASNGFISTNTQSAIEEINNNAIISASPGYSFGRSGLVTKGTYLQNETVPSNISGRWVYLFNANIVHLYISNEISTTFTVEVLSHDGNEVNLTSLGSVTITAAKGEDFSVTYPVAHNKQIAVRISPTSANNPKNVVCGIQLTGTTV